MDILHLAAPCRNVPVTFTLDLMEESVSTSAHLNELQRIADGYGVDVDVRAVPSIQAWCKEVGLDEENPFLCGKALWNSESQRHLILLADPITREMRASVLGAMEFRGRVAAEDLSLLKHGTTFLRHLLLHEMAHVLDPQREEVECDIWAFNELRSAP